jgi:hypothetical protein
MAVSPAAVRELKKRCNLKPKVLKEALAATRGDVETAMLRLIDAGQVMQWDLNPHLVPEELFVRAKRGELQATLARREEMLKTGSWDAMWRKILRGEISELKGWLRDKKEFTGLRDAALASVARKQESKQRKQQRAARGKLKLPPLPPLTLESDEWTGRDKLASYAGFRAGKEKASTSGGVTVEIPRLDEDDANPAPPAAEHIAAYTYLKANETKVTDTVLRAVVKYVKQLERDDFFGDDHTTADGDPAPVIRTPAALKRNIALHGVNVLEYAKAGHAYIGLDFRCTWDEEHQLGVLLHKSRVVAVGQADTSFDHHAALDDGGKALTIEPKRQPKQQKVRRRS